MSCSEEWLKRKDQNAAAIRPIMESTQGEDSAAKWTAHRRTLFISVAELSLATTMVKNGWLHFTFSKRNRQQFPQVGEQIGVAKS